MENFIEPLKERDEFIYSNIYLFTKSKKLRFDIKKTVLTNKRTLKTSINIGHNNKISIESSLYNIAPIIREIYGTEEDYNYLCSDDDDFWTCEIDDENSSNDRIRLLQKAKTGEIFDFWISPENIENTEIFESNSNYNCQPEVVYVGQSFRMIDRISSHKTLHRAVSELKDDEDLKIFFATFKYGYGGHRNFADIFNGNVSKIWMSQHGKSKEYKSKIDLVERFLIHFLQPKYNSQHKKTKIQNDELVKSILLENDIDVVSLNIGVNGKNFEFWSEKQQVKTEYCSFNFLEPEKGYQNGLITNKINE
ncbi:hypothetical protein QO206_11190 [Leeuwenhoekiella aequorea]|uniref:hypothetical protein n=1 Tax=Leeuwenhoekiella aequorea TaxID=283736 RepID=UPI00352D6DA5